MELHCTFGTEALAPCVRFWVSSVPPLPDSVQAAAQAKGRERYEGFADSLGRRLAKGKSLADKVSRDVEALGSRPDA